MLRSVIVLGSCSAETRKKGRTFSSSSKNGEKVVVVMLNPPGKTLYEEFIFHFGFHLPLRIMKAVYQSLVCGRAPLHRFQQSSCGSRQVVYIRVSVEVVCGASWLIYGSLHLDCFVCG